MALSYCLETANRQFCSIAHTMLTKMPKPAYLNEKKKCQAQKHNIAKLLINCHYAQIWSEMP